VEQTKSEETKSEETKSEETMDEQVNFSSQNTALTSSAVCPRCQFHPASPRIAGYCSWDCYEADDDAAELTVAESLDAEKTAWRAAFACA
jgi:hypothetical protein